MSEPIPESIPTSADPRSHRPTKRLALTPRAVQASTLNALFAHPEKQITIPNTSLSSTTHTSHPPEIVANVQGSSAGAGSGEFHVYKASRRREYERLRAMDEEVLREGEEKEFLKRKEELERLDREKTERNRAKRAKALARKKKGKKGGDAAAVEEKGQAGKKKLVPNAGVKTGDAGAEDEEKDKEEGPAVTNVEEIGLVIEDDD